MMQAFAMQETVQGPNHVNVATTDYNIASNGVLEQRVADTWRRCHGDLRGCSRSYCRGPG
jgi:hypothetical protein